jgi:hypothetical protein
MNFYLKKEHGVAYVAAESLDVPGDVLDLIEVYGLSLDTKLDKVLEVMNNRLKDMDQGLSNRD